MHEPKTTRTALQKEARSPGTAAELLLPLIQLLEPALHRVRVVLLGDLLQEVESLLEHAEQVLLELHRHAVLGHEFVDAGHGQHPQTAPFLPQHRVVAAAVDRGHFAGAAVTAKAREVEDGGEQGRGDARGQGDPAEEVCQALQCQRADVFTVCVQDGDGLVQ